MWERLRPRITFANVVSCLALFVALGGSAYAVKRLPKNSVGTKQIKKNAVNSAKVRNHTLRAADFKAGQLPAGPRGPEGPAGKEGPRGLKGDPGPDFGPDSGYSPQLASVANQTIVGGADVPFSGPSNLGSNISHTGGATTFTVGSGGRYRLFWAASNTVGVGSALAVAVNGTVAAGTTIPVLTATGHVSGEAIVQLAAGDVITVRNNSAVPMTLALSPSVGASLTIQRIA